MTVGGTATIGGVGIAKRLVASVCDLRSPGRIIAFGESAPTWAK